MPDGREARLAVRSVLQPVDDEVHSLRTELLAIGTLLRLAAESKEGLDVDECRGLFVIVSYMTLQARRVEDAYDAAFDI